MEMFKFLGALAGVVLTIGSVQILLVNRFLLPKALQPPRWRQVLLVACGLFYLAVTTAVIVEQVRKFTAED